MQYGLVLYRDPERGAGLVWCEDCGELAAINHTTRISGAGTLGSGALVLMSTVKNGATRVCSELVLTDGRRDDIVQAMRTARERIRERPPDKSRPVPLKLG